MSLYPGETLYPSETLFPGESVRVAPSPRPVPVPVLDPLQAALSSATTITTHVTSTLGGDVLAEEVPILGGSLTASVQLDTLTMLSLTVPARDRGTSWVPGDDPVHPLGAYGQRLTVTQQVTLADGVHVERLGVFRVSSWDAGDDTVGVVAAGLLKAVAENRPSTPMAVRAGGTMASEAIRLMDGVLPLVVDDALEDRLVPDGMSWGDDRVEALRDIAEAWPARLRVDDYGTVYMLPPLASVASPVYRLTEGVNGTLVGTQSTGSREGVHNRIIARGTESAREGVPAVWGMAQVEVGPLSVHGPYGISTDYLSSPLLTSRSQAAVAANTRLQAQIRPARAVPVTCAPDPRIRLDDAVEVARMEGPRVWGWVTGYELPLLGASGDAMRIDIGIST